MLSVTIWIVRRQSPVLWAYRDKCTWTHILTESLYSDYRTLSQNKHKKALKKKKVAQPQARALSDAKAVLLYTCGDRDTTCIHKPNASDLSIHNQHTGRGCPLHAKSSLKSDLAVGSNSSYLKSPWLLLKNRSCLLILLMSFYLECVALQQRQGELEMFEHSTD